MAIILSFLKQFLSFWWFEIQNTLFRIRLHEQKFFVSIYLLFLNIEIQSDIYTFVGKHKINNPKDVQQHVLKMILGKSTGTERRNKHDWCGTTLPWQLLIWERDFSIGAGLSHNEISIFTWILFLNAYGYCKIKDWNVMYQPNY